MNYYRFYTAVICFSFFGCADESKVLPRGICGTDAWGYETPAAPARKALEQANCHRELMGLHAGTLHSKLDRASQNHADYMATHNRMSHQENSGEAGYTGEWVWDRIDAVGYSLEGGSAWSEVVSQGYGAAAAVDGWVGTVYHRIPFTQPNWRDVGFGFTDSFAAMTFVMPYPDGVHQGVMYPVDGQSDVPTSFDSDTEWPDPAPNHGVIGYPITVTVAGTEGPGSYSDPFNTRLIDAILFDENGAEVEIITKDPSTDEDLVVMAAMMPVEPLEAGMTYEAEMTVQWNGDEQVFTAEFTTRP